MLLLVKLQYNCERVIRVQTYGCFRLKQLFFNDLLSCFLAPKDFYATWFYIFCFSTYLMKVIPKTCRVHYIWYLCTYYLCATQPNLLSTMIGNRKISILWRIYLHVIFNTTETPFSYRTKIHMYTSIVFIFRIYLWGLVASLGER
jgi:hypothetical protein